MRFIGWPAWVAVACLSLAPAAGAQEHVTLQELFAYPYIYGNGPVGTRWSPDSKSVAFLWNERGERFRDLYVADASGGKPVRLTDLTDYPRLPVQDDDRTPEEVERDAQYDGGVSQFDWSPDSRQVAFVFRGDVFLVDVRGRGAPRCLIRSRAGESTVRFSPDGEVLSFVQSQNLWTYHLGTGETRQITTLSKNRQVLSYPTTSSIHTYHWSPDGSMIALLVWDTDALEDIVIPDYLPDRVDAAQWKRNYTGTPVFETQVGVVDREGGLVRWVDWGDDPCYNNSETEYNRDIEWSPDSKSLLINWNDKDYKTRRILLADARTLDLTEAYSERQEPFLRYLDARWSRDGRTIYLTSEKDGFRHLYALDRDGGALRQLTRGEWDVLEILVPERSPQVFLASTQAEPRERHLYAVSPVDGASRRLTFLPGTYEAVVSPDGRYAAARFSQVLRPPDLCVFSIEDPGKLRWVTESPLPPFARLRRAEPEYFEFRNEEDGARIRGFLVKPADFDPSRKYPAVLSCVYADIAKNAWISYDLLDYYMANEMGYIVVRIDLRASNGYGRDFRYGYYQKMGIIDAGECVSAARYLRSLPYVDGHRIGIWGSSYGGFLTLMTLFLHPGEFQAGAAWKPVTDWRNYTDDYTAQRLGRPEEFPDVYRATSPIHHVEGLKDPLLIVHGMVDDNVLFQDTVQLVQKLLEAGKEFDVMLYPRADHGLTYWQENRLDLMLRTARFFREKMGTGPVP